MIQEEIKKYQTKLESEKRLIMSEIKEAEKPTDFGGDIDHGDENSDQTEEVGNRLAIEQDLKLRLDDVDVALEKIRTGKYGICETCGKEIEKEILDVDPESRLCKSDKLKA